jgi:transcriptional regulator with XRE-family HTH domain
MKTLRELREAAGLTQLELAKRAHLDRTRVSLSESGYVQLSAAEEERIRAVVLEAARARAAKLQGVIAVAANS